MSGVDPSRASFSPLWPENMRPKLAAEYLGTSKGWLDQGRCYGTGPKFVRLSRTMVIYRKADLDEWLAARVVSSTSEADQAAEEASP